MCSQTKRSLELADAAFKRKLGVKRATFETMLAVLKTRETHKNKRGRTPALCLEDQLVLALSFWREYRTHFHLAEDWDVDESTVRRTIERVEDALIGSGQFSLPGRKALRDEQMSMTWKSSSWTSLSHRLSVPKKQRAYYSGKKRCHNHKSQVIVWQGGKRILSSTYGKGRTHDFKVLKQSRCATSLHQDTELYAEGGFQGVARLHPKSSTPHKRWRGKVLSSEQKDHNRTLAKVRILAEHAIRRLKVFRILKETYRHRRRRFALRLNLIAALYNHDLQVQ